MSQQIQFPQQDQFSPLSLADHPPASPDSFGMSGLPQPAEAGMPFLGQYTFMASCDVDNRDALGAMHGFGASPGEQSLFLPNLSNQHCEPWTHLRAAQPGNGQLGTRQPSSLPYNLNYENFNTFRDQAAPSEADTISRSACMVQSDSGYGSMARQSVGNPSVYSGDGAETRSLIGAFQQRVNLSAEEKSRKREERSQRSTSANPNVDGLTCSICHAHAKTKSELKKHVARHEKPFKCDEPDCPKAIEGFSTRNDRDRHKKCVHGVLRTDETVFRCNLDQCKDKPKDWPRQDNFKSHLSRKHGIKSEDVDLAPFTHRLSSSTDLAGLGMSEAISTEPRRILGSYPAAPPPWTEPGLDSSVPLRPVNTLPRDESNSQSGNNTHFTNHAFLMEDRDFTSLMRADVPQFLNQNLQQDAPARSMNNARAHSAPIEPQISPQDARTISTEEPPLAGQSPYVAPDVLSRTHAEFRPSLPPTETQLCPREVIQLDADDLSGGLEQSDQSKRKIEAHVPDEGAPEEAPEDTACEDDVQDTDTEEATLESTDEQARLTPNSGIESTDVPTITVKSPSSEQEPEDDTSKQGGLDEEGSAILRTWMERGILDNLLKEVGYLKPTDLEAKGPSPPPAPSVSTNKPGVKCEQCGKTFQRPCELKKHRKRHARPYACTFARCDKTFGSKNDWKRHETSQHFQPELWRCNENLPDRPVDECGKACLRRELLKSHLQKDHGIREHDMLEKKLAECRMGRNFESRFWCGFCRKIVESTGTDGPAHSSRFDHIDNHFNGRGMPQADIKDWKHVDADPLDAPGSEGGHSAHGRVASSSDTPARPSKHRKRLHPSDGDASSARPKRPRGSSGAREVYWSCCVCENYWSKESYVMCFDSGCGHAYCKDCTVFEMPDEKKLADDDVSMT